MVIRTLCFVAMVAVSEPVALRLFLAAGAVFLPYVAVIVANAVTADDDTADQAVSPLHGPGTQQLQR